MQVRSRPIFCVLTCATALLSAYLVIAQPHKRSIPEKLSDGIMLRVGDSFLKVEVCTDSVIHVAFSKDRTFFARQTLAAAPKQCEATPWKFTRGERDGRLGHLHRIRGAAVRHPGRLPQLSLRRRAARPATATWPAGPGATPGSR